MTTVTFADELVPKSAGTKSLRMAVKFWLVVAVIGQWAFLYYIVAFYGVSTLTGNIQDWSRNANLFKGYVAGDTVGNLTFGMHVLLAATIAFGGALQLIPRIRARSIGFHRWNGRVFVVTALGVSITGLYMVWVRGGPTLAGALSISLNAVLIIIFSVLAWRSAVTRNIAQHRRWALRTYMVANGQWFFRVGIFACVIIDRGQIATFYNLWGVGCYLVPLAILELYLRTTDRPSPRGRYAMAGGLTVLTVIMGLGIFGVAAFMWRPLL